MGRIFPIKEIADAKAKTRVHVTGIRELEDGVSKIKGYRLESRGS